MVKQIVIGKQGDQPFPINDPNVSRRHAVLYIDDATGQINLVDNTSTNGTYISNGANFQRIPPNQPVQVRPETMIQLGPDTRFHVRRLLPATPPKPKTKRVNIKELRNISENYLQRKEKLDGQTTSLQGLRSLSIVFTVIATTGSAFLADALGMEKGQTAIVTVGVLVVLVVSFQLIISQRLKKVAAEKNENERTYAVKYCCPECHFSFRGKYYENILASGKCPNCKCEYYE